MGSSPWTSRKLILVAWLQKLECLSTPLVSCRIPDAAYASVCGPFSPAMAADDQPCERIWCLTFLRVMDAQLPDMVCLAVLNLGVDTAALAAFALLPLLTSLGVACFQPSPLRRLLPLYSGRPAAALLRWM